MTTALTRGALIVLEGVDKSGKSTQCKHLVKNLCSRGFSSELWRFPERSTAVGKVINDYLEKNIELEDHAVHLLFSANRWESVPRMKSLIDSGVTLVVDRYAYSGVAFTSAKEGFITEWCRTPDVGLPEPDLVIYLTLDPKLAASRGDFGGERYERTEFQIKVQQNFASLMDNSWKIVEASRSVEEIEEEVLQHSLQSIRQCCGKPLGRLWTPQSSTKPESSVGDQENNKNFVNVAVQAS